MKNNKRLRFTDFDAAVIAAMKEMDDVNIPVKSFEPCKRGGYDFVFKRGLTKALQKKAKTIAKKWLGGKWYF